MTRWSRRSVTHYVVVSMISLTLIMLPSWRGDAADHRDAPIIIGFQSFDINDLYFFLDPNNNSRAVLALDFGGPIVPHQNASAGFFNPNVNFRFQIENSGDAAGDKFIDIHFSKAPVSVDGLVGSAVITVSISDGLLAISPRTFTALTTPSSSTAETAPPPVITVDGATGIAVFAGLVDDPFFYDAPAGLRYLASRRAGSPDEKLLTRARDSFAGYNTLMVALSIPIEQLRGPAGDVVGLAAYTQTRQMVLFSPDFDPQYAGSFVNVDRMGVPSINTFFIPYGRRDEYNRAATTDDAAGRFTDDILGTLTALGTTHRASINSILRYVRRGDMLRLNLTTANAGGGGGINTQAGFPNGRRPNDDVIDTILTLVNNRVSLGDRVDRNDIAFRDTFPFFAQPHQPLPAGVIDDRTRN